VSAAAGECPDHKLMEAAELVLLATQPGHPDPAGECSLLIELVQTARIASLCVGSAWSVESRVDLWIALGACMDAHISRPAADPAAHSNLREALELFREDPERELCPPASAQQISCDLRVSREAPC
jgi:hypothetical protein